MWILIIRRSGIIRLDMPLSERWSILLYGGRSLKRLTSRHLPLPFDNVGNDFHLDLPYIGGYDFIHLTNEVVGGIYVFIPVFVVRFYEDCVCRICVRYFECRVHEFFFVQHLFLEILICLTLVFYRLHIISCGL